MPTQTRTFFGFQHQKTGELVRLDSRESDYRLSTDKDEPVFEAPSPEALANILFENTPHYNTSPECPAWGGLDALQLIPVQVSVSLQLEPLTLTAPLRVRTLQLRDIPYKVARSYVGGDFELNAERPGVIFWLVELPAEVTLETLQESWIGHTVHGRDRYSKRQLYAAVPVPEEYVPLTDGKRNCALLIASGSFY